MTTTVFDKNALSRFWLDVLAPLLALMLWSIHKNIPTGDVTLIWTAVGLAALLSLLSIFVFKRLLPLLGFPLNSVSYLFAHGTFNFGISTLVMVNLYP